MTKPPTMSILLPNRLARRKRSIFSSAIASRRAASSSSVHPFLKFGSSAPKYLTPNRDQSVPKLIVLKKGEAEADYPLRTGLDTAFHAVLERSLQSVARAPSAGPHRPMRPPTLRPPRASKALSWQTVIRCRTAPEPDSEKRLSILHLPLCKQASG